MKLNILGTGALAFCLSASLPAFAEISEGDAEVAASFSISMPDEGDDTTTFIGSYGVMMSDTVQAEAGLFYAESAGLSFGQLSLGGEFYPAPRAELMPYLGGGYSLSIGDFDDSDFFNLRAGVKTFVSESTTVFAEVIRLEAVDSDFSDFGQTQLLVGFSVFF